jgi:hypothetical protein
MHRKKTAVPRLRNAAEPVLAPFAAEFGDDSGYVRST